jgi:Ca2+-transporting ATPase
VANVPEVLLPTITLALAVGVRRMARRRALAMRVSAVETLGSTDVICTDKTGTVTEGRMSVRLLWADGVELPIEGAAPVDGHEPFSAILRTAVPCSNATIARTDGGWERSGDPTKSALLVGLPGWARTSSCSPQSATGAAGACTTSIRHASG